MLKPSCIFLTCIVLSVSCFSQKTWSHGRLKVTPDGHYIQYEDGTPFFWLGDTGWELFHRLKKEEIKLYLENRSRKGFNLIQAVVFAEFDGKTKPNQYGDLPFHDLDPTRPNEKYFLLVDTVMKMAMEKNLYIGLLPTWGDKVISSKEDGPAVFNESNAYVYGQWIGNRYKDWPNIIWILGGDRSAKKDSSDWRPIWRAMAKGILDGTNGKAFITYHPSGGPYSTSQYIHNETWLNMNMMQSGHGDGHDVRVWDLVERDRNYLPVKPTLDGEPNYEDHPVNPWPKWDSANGYFNDYDVRKQTYRSVFAGACGVTYGHHSVWQFWSAREIKINHADCYWTEAIDRPGAFQVGYLRKLIESRDPLNRIPDQSVILSGQGDKGTYITAFRDSVNRYAMIYLPYGKTITVRTDWIKTEKIIAWWFNPKNGKATKIGSLKRENEMAFTTPSSGFLNDWVLILDNPGYAFPLPGAAK